MLKKIISTLIVGSIFFCAVSSPLYICSANENLDNLMLSDPYDYGEELFSYINDEPIVKADEPRPDPEDIPVNESIIGLDESVIKVMIDPGHSGYENPSPVYSSYYESVMTLKLSYYLKEELELLGVHADMTKYSLEEEPALLERGYKSKGYDFFVSIHSNAASYSSMDKPIAICYQNLSWTTIDDTSREIGGILASKVAEVMQTNQKGEIFQRLSVRDRDGNGVYDDEWYGVLSGSRYVDTPGILLEHSFHTNYRATVWLSNDDNLKKLAKGEAEVIFNYFTEKKAAEMATATTTTTTETSTTVPVSSTTETTATTPIRIDPVPKENFISGDVNGDDEISLNDAVYVLEYYAMQSSGLPAKFIQLEDNPDGEEMIFKAADIISDGKIDLMDATEILKLYAEHSAGITD